MAVTSTPAHTIRAITTAVPHRIVENVRDSSEFTQQEVDAVVKMVGVKRRHVAEESICSSDLCRHAADDVLTALEWDPASIKARPHHGHSEPGLFSAVHRLPPAPRFGPF